MIAIVVFCVLNFKIVFSVFRVSQQKHQRMCLSGFDAFNIIADLTLLAQGFDAVRISILNRKRGMLPLEPSGK